MLTPMPVKSSLSRTPTDTPTSITISSPISHLTDLAKRLSKNSGWNPQVEKEILSYSSDCQSLSQKHKQIGKRLKRWGQVAHISLVLLGSVGVFCNSVPSLDPSLRQILSGLFGACTTFIGSVNAFYRFDQHSLLHDQVGEGLQSLERSIRMETFKPYALRSNPMELLLFADETKEKLLKRVNS